MSTDGARGGRVANRADDRADVHLRSFPNDEEAATAALVLRATAPAKVNLTLHVTGRRPDGYHLLDSLVAFADLGDVLHMTDGDALRVTGPFAAGVPDCDDNLIRRALQRAGAPKAVTLEKQLPHPAGLGGGSSDAATALRMAGAELDSQALLELGADLPVCMAARFARMEGIGEKVTPVAAPMLHAVLVNPKVPVPTDAVFRNLASPDNAPHPRSLPTWSDGHDLLDWLVLQRNDLEAPARKIAPIIGAVLDALREAGAATARMTGSGGTCFGLWHSRKAAEDAARALRRTDLWVRACSLS